MSMKKMVYIAGPYTKPDPVINTRKAIDAWFDLMKRGYVPIVPHLGFLIHLVYPRPIEFWYKYDLEIMKRCDLVLRLPGESVGADLEVKAAIEAKIPVFTGEVEDFLEWDQE